MSEKMKLKLDDLKVKSFVTSINDHEKKNVKGGTIVICTIITIVFSCIDDTVQEWTETSDPMGACGCGCNGGTAEPCEPYNDIP